MKESEAFAAFLTAVNPTKRSLLEEGCDACYICLDRGGTVPLGCACRRMAHIDCAEKWHVPRMYTITHAKLVDEASKAIVLVCQCDTCLKPLDQHLLHYFYIKQQSKQLCDVLAQTKFLDRCIVMMISTCICTLVLLVYVVLRIYF